MRATVPTTPRRPDPQSVERRYDDPFEKKPRKMHFHPPFVRIANHTFVSTYRPMTLLLSRPRRRAPASWQTSPALLLRMMIL